MLLFFFSGVIVCLYNAYIGEIKSGNQAFLVLFGVC